MRIGEYIKYKRSSLGYTQKQLAEHLEISKQAVSKWEKSDALPDIMLIPDIAFALKVKPEFLMNIIWTGDTGERVEHFVWVNVKEKNGTSYPIKIYSTYDFLYAKEVYDSICAGQNEPMMQTLLDFYNYDPCRSFSVQLLEYVFYENEESPRKSLLIESKKLNSLIKSYAQLNENT